MLVDWLSINSRRPVEPYFYQKCSFERGHLRLFRFSERSTYNDAGDKDEAQLVLESYPVVKTTRCGFWISVWGKNKFVMNSDGQGGKRWAYTDPTLALESYLIRKEHHISHLKRKLRIACGGRKLARNYAPRSYRH